MANNPTQSSVKDVDLFTGLKFWLSHQVPMRSTYIQDVRKRGGTVVASEPLADMRIIDDARKKPPIGEGEYYSYKYIEESLKNNRLPEPDAFIVGGRSATDRPVGSTTIAPKGKRNAFTKQDDQILYNWLEPYRQNGGKWKGNEIYKQLACKYPHHTFQSWRSRYLLMVSQSMKMSITEHINPFAETQGDDADFPQERSPKRRRIEVPSTTVHANAASPVRNSIPSPNTELGVSAVEEPEAPTDPKGIEQKPQSLGEKLKENAVRLGKAISEPNNAVKTVLARFTRPDPSSDTNLPPEADVEEPADKQVQLPSSNQVGPNLCDDGISDSGSVEHTPRYFTRQGYEVDERLREISKQQKFTIRHIKELYKAVPDIHQTEPQDLAKSWEDVAQSWGQHSAAEWRYFYETVILPEYMRRNKLETEGDLDRYVNDLLAKEQGLTTSEKVVISEAESTINIQAKQCEDTDQDPVLLKNQASISRHLPQSPQNQGNGVDVFENQFKNSQGPSAHPAQALTSQSAKNNRDNGTTDPQTSFAQSESSLQPVTIQSSQISPKKRLFGRTLDPEVRGPQSQASDTVANPTTYNENSFGATSAAASLGVSSNDQSLSSSKQPPESGQRPPNNSSTSQQGSNSISDAVQIVASTSERIDAIVDTDRTLDHQSRTPAVSRDSSPVLNLLSEDLGQRDDVRSSPAPSDTGSEYLTFENAPERSQLWNPSQDEFQDHARSDANTSSEHNNRHDARNISFLNSASQVSEPATVRRAGTPIPQLISSQESGSPEDESESESYVSGGGSPELDVQVVTHIKAAPRIETQFLFQQSLSDAEGDTTIFDIPPPEGGWELLGELEEDMEDIRTSVEVVEEVLVKDGRETSSSRTQEELSMPIGVQRHDVQSTHEIIDIFDNSDNNTDDDSDRTTFSEHYNNEDLVRNLLRKSRTPQSSPVSSELDRTTTSHANSIPRAEYEANESEASLTSSAEDNAIESWLSDQSAVYSFLNEAVFARLASTALQATVINLSAATFTLRDLVGSFKQSEVKRKADFDRGIHLKREHTDSTPAPRFQSKTMLTEEEARLLLPKDVLGVWTIEDDKDFLSQTKRGIERVERKHGVAGLRKRAKFLRARYGLEGLDFTVTPRSVLSKRKERQW